MDSTVLRPRITEKLLGRTSKLVVAIATVLSLFAMVPRPAAADANSDEQVLVGAINGSRVANGLAPLTFDRTAADRVARPWAASMATSNALAHNPNYRAQITERVGPWQRVGENVGFSSGGAGALHDQFMGSQGHRDNILGDYNRVGIGVAYANGKMWVVLDFTKGYGGTHQAVGVSTNAPRNGYLIARSTGTVRAFGAMPHRGDLAGAALTQPIVGISSTPSGYGYWMVASDGGIFTFGDAPFLGSTGAMRLNRPIVAMASTPSGRGYWLVASDGGIFTFGDAAFRGSTGAMRLNSPIVGMTPTPGGGGYWLVASDGGIFTFGDAAFRGSAGAMRLNRPIVGMTSTPGGGGYWLVASDGGIFSFNAPFYGSAGAINLNSAVLGMAASEGGYWLAAGDGGIFNYNAPFMGSAA